mmetsp:Transcript_2156/g.5470  ORF Transcript_2156/g.5470 Transcript_2156/m.5470 type:complete len:688 (+) Transcript_2156:191-2254(+)
MMSSNLAVGMPAAAGVKAAPPCAPQLSQRATWRPLRRSKLAAAGGDRSHTIRADFSPAPSRPERRDVDVSASAASTTTESTVQTEHVTWDGPEDVEIIAEATQEMGVEDLFESVEAAEVEILRSFEDTSEELSGASLAEALQYSEESKSGASQPDSATKSSSQCTEVGLTYPSSDVKMPTYAGAELEVGVAHFGVGGFFRAHQLAYMDYLLRHNLEQNKGWGYMGIGVLPHDKAMRDALREQENMYTIIAHSAQAVSATGHSEDDLNSELGLKENVHVVAALKDMLLAPEEPGEVLRTLSSEGCKIYSLTITEFGYTVPTSRGDMALLRAATDAAKGPWGDMDANAKEFSGATALGMIVAGLQARRSAGSGGATVLSCDNIPGNGDYVKAAVLERAEKVGDGLKEWIQFNCTFPNCMVDRITPMTPNELIGELAEKHGMKDNWPVNCETFTQWVVEDKFVDGINGRPLWENVGVQLVKDVEPYELTKIRLLNVIHTTMVFPALLMGLEYIHEAAQHPLVKKYYTTIMGKELRPTLEVIEGIENIDLDKYQEVLIGRFSNEVIADTLLRVAMDTSDKLSVQGVPATLDGFQVGANMKGMAFCVASWGHFIHRSVEAGHVLRDQKARIVEAAMEGKDINALLDIEFIFHELIFHEKWREMIVHYYESIHKLGITVALEKMLADYDSDSL